MYCTSILFNNNCKDFEDNILSRYIIGLGTR